MKHLAKRLLTAVLAAAMTITMMPLTAKTAMAEEKYVEITTKTTQPVNEYYSEFRNGPAYLDSVYTLGDGFGIGQYSSGDWFSIYYCDIKCDEGFVIKKVEAAVSYASSETAYQTFKPNQGTVTFANSIFTVSDLDTDDLYISFDSSLRGQYLTISSFKVYYASTNENSGSFELDGSETDPAVVDQYYNVEQIGETEYTDVKNVKVDWKTEDIEVTYKNKKKWDPQAKKWVKASTADDYTNRDGGAEFTFTNFSSVAVAAKVAFNAADEAKAALLDAVIFEDGKDTVTIGTPVEREDGDKVYAESDFEQGTIKVVLSVNKAASMNASKTNRSEHFGTYTVSIADAD